jgi:heme oxygenase (mycobilin-producing)
VREDVTMSIVKINALTVPDEMRESLEQRFSARAGMVENSDGFEWFELLRPLDGTDKYLVYTRWRSEADFEKWMSESTRTGHGGGGGRPAASGSEAWTFDVIQQTGPKAS